MSATESVTGVGYDRRRALQAFDDTKAGIKGLLDAGITAVPPIFHHPPEYNEGVTSPTGDIPTIDLLASQRREDVVAQVWHAATTLGIFRVVNHGVPAELMASMLAGVRQFNEEPAEVKRAVYSRDQARKVRFFSNVDLFKSSAAQWRDTLVLEVAPDPPCPEELPESLRNVAMEYGKAVTKVALCVLELMSESLNLSSDHLHGIGLADKLRMVCQYYPPCQEPHLTCGIRRHTDVDILTVLLADGMGGLQVHVDGRGTWVDVPQVPGALMVNVGDFLQLVSNDQFRSAEHRVLANKSKDTARVSVASFFNTDITRSSRLYGPITDGVNPPIYRSVTAGEYRDTFNSIGPRWSPARLLPVGAYTYCVVGVHESFLIKSY